MQDIVRRTRWAQAFSDAPIGSGVRTLLATMTDRTSDNSDVERDIRASHRGAHGWSAPGGRRGRAWWCGPAVLIGFVILIVGGCHRPGKPSYEYLVADPWELKGPFKVFERDLGSGKAKASAGMSSERRGPGAHRTQQETGGAQQGTGRARQETESAGLRTEAVEPGAAGAESESPDESARRDPESAGSLRLRYDLPMERYTERPGLFSHGVSADEDYWYLDVGFRMGQIRLAETHKQLDVRLNGVMAVFDPAGVFASPTTPVDRKSDFAMTTQYIGVGRRETDWLTWNFYLGYGFGGDPNHQRVLNLNLDVDFEYNIIYTGLTTDLYPWGKPKHANYPNWRERFYASRPYLLSGFEFAYVRAEGRGTFRIAPLTVYRDRQAIEDWLFSYLIGLGWELPIDDRWSWATSIHYTLHFYRPEEYNGWNVTYALRYRF